MNYTVTAHPTTTKHSHTLYQRPHEMARFGRRTTLLWAAVSCLTQLLYWAGLTGWTIVDMWGLSGIVEKFYQFLVPESWNQRAMNLWDKSERKILKVCQRMKEMGRTVFNWMKKIKWKNMGQPRELDTEDPFGIIILHN